MAWYCLTLADLRGAAAAEAQQSRSEKEPPPPSRRSYAQLHQAALPQGPQPLPIHPSPVLTPRQHADLNPDLPFSGRARALDEHGHMRPASRTSSKSPSVERLTADPHRPEAERMSSRFSRNTQPGRLPPDHVRGNSSISIGDRISAGMRASMAAAADGYAMAEYPEERGPAGGGAASSRRSFDYAANAHRMGVRQPEQVRLAIICMPSSIACTRPNAAGWHGHVRSCKMRKGVPPAGICMSSHDVNGA